MIAIAIWTPVRSGPDTNENLENKTLTNEEVKIRKLYLISDKLA